MFGIIFELRVFVFYFRALDNYRVKLQLWDTAGQERFRSMVGPSWSSGVICLFIYLFVCLVG